MLILKTTDSKLESKNGQRLEVLRVITEPDAAHDAEVLPMYAVRLEDGSETELWFDEIAHA
jgi:hypothetical protein